MWEKIVLNLLSNAFKYTFEGSIRVTLREREGKARLTVEDTGIGIAADQVSRVFERFHRVEGARGRTIEGTGIGLALVQELTRLHGGTVGVESHEGLGSRFTVEIPLGHAHLPAERIQAFPEPTLRRVPGDLRRTFEPLAMDGVESAARIHSGQPSGEPRERVLLVDDNADMREYVGRLLGEQYEVEVAPNGRAALAALDNYVPDIVLSDVMMPELDGFGLVRAIREDSRLATLPVILISARAGEEATVEGLEQGADDYLVKPFTAGELKARVASNLKLARLRRDAADREQQLRREAERAEARMVEALESITDAFISLDREGRYMYVNHVAAAMGQRQASELIGKVLWDEFPETRESGLLDAVERVIHDRKPAQFDYHHAASDRWTEWRAYPTADGVAALVTDVTQKRRLEAQLQQSAKLESLGVLAGGVAHDFNNLLVGILGNASLAEDMLPDSHPAKEVVHEAVRASERAAELTQQLLAYSGKGRFVVELIDLAELVRDNLVLLKTSIAANVELKTVLPDNLAAVRADRAQMQQVVMNLMINAAEAIGSRPGRVSLELREVEVHEGTDPRARQLRTPRGKGQRVRHDRGNSGPDFRSVLHYQVYGARSGPRGGAGHCPGAPWGDSGREYAGGGDHVPGSAPRRRGTPPAPPAGGWAGRCREFRHGVDYRRRGDGEANGADGAAGARLPDADGGEWPGGGGDFRARGGADIGSDSGYDHAGDDGRTGPAAAEAGAAKRAGDSFERIHRG